MQRSVQYASRRMPTPLADQQVVADSVLRDVAYADPGTPVWLVARDCRTSQHHIAPTWQNKSGDRFERRALARPVASEQRHGLALIDSEIDAEQSSAGAVEHIDTRHLKHGSCHALRR